MSISRFAAVTDAILATLRAETGLGNVEVMDGPPTQGQTSDSFLWVGWNGDPDDASAGSIRQNYHDLGPTATRDEVVEVYCTIQVGRGDDEMAQARSDAIACLGVVESALRANVSLGLADLLRVEMSDSSVRQIRDQLGIAVEIDFTVTATALI